MLTTHLEESSSEKLSISNKSIWDPITVRIAVRSEKRTLFTLSEWRHENVSHLTLVEKGDRLCFVSKFQMTSSSKRGKTQVAGVRKSWDTFLEWSVWSSQVYLATAGRYFQAFQWYDKVGPAFCFLYISQKLPEMWFLDIEMSEVDTGLPALRHSLLRDHDCSRHVQMVQSDT